VRIISKKTVVLAALAAGTVIGQSTAVAATPPPVNPLPTVEQVRELTKGKNRTPPPINPLPTKEELDLLKKGEPLPGDAKRDSALSPHAPTLLQDLPPQDVYFANCAEVKNQGKAPLGKDQPGYRITLDPDGDGLACEDREGGDAPQAQGQAPIQPQAAPAPAPVQPQPPAPAPAARPGCAPPPPPSAPPPPGAGPGRCSCCARPFPRTGTCAES
jgi:protein VASP homolog